MLRSPFENVIHFLKTKPTLKTNMFRSPLTAAVTFLHPIIIIIILIIRQLRDAVLYEWPEKCWGTVWIKVHPRRFFWEQKWEDVLVWEGLQCRKSSFGKCWQNICCEGVFAEPRKGGWGGWKRGLRGGGGRRRGGGGQDRTGKGHSIQHTTQHQCVEEGGWS